jgi:hypothetical protein
MTYHHFLRLNAYGLDNGQVAGNTCKDGKKVSRFDEARGFLSVEASKHPSSLVEVVGGERFDEFRVQN